ncbi:MAG: phosphate acyltransferase PlsX [Flavobacteriales bacterium]|nr:phosphate acyltransferase PlsX [Flavobacteriales bacterium]
MRIGIDIMGSDFAPSVPIQGVLLAQKELDSDIEIVLLGKEDEIKSSILEEGGNPDDFEIINCDEVIEMKDSPIKALSKKRNSSISIGFKMLVEKNLDGFTGAGNTGAMMAGAMFSVKNVPGVIRPCVISFMPKENGECNVLVDVGSNADCKSDVMYQFGTLGSLYSNVILNVDNPKVGLLNLGREPGKGNLLTQATYELMEDSKDFNFVGNVEGNEIFDEGTDVIVTDGFTGNVVLKSMEKIHGLLKKRDFEMDNFFQRFDYQHFGGSPILGVNAPVVVGHGSSTPEAIKNMINLTRSMIEKKLCEKTREAFN